MSDNPFIEFSREGEAPVYPKFPKPHTITIKLSSEALSRLNELALRYTGKENLSALLEQIGVYALDLERPENLIDEESAVTTEDCRASGFEDGKIGNPNYFLQMFNKPMHSKFQAAYMRGFMEGNWIRTRTR